MLTGTILGVDGYSSCFLPGQSETNLTDGRPFHMEGSVADAKLGRLSVGLTAIPYNFHLQIKNPVDSQVGSQDGSESPPTFMSSRYNLSNGATCTC